MRSTAAAENISEPRFESKLALETIAHQLAEIGLSNFLFDDAALRVEHTFRAFAPGNEAVKVSSHTAVQAQFGCLAVELGVGDDRYGAAQYIRMQTPSQRPPGYQMTSVLKVPAQLVGGLTQLAFESHTIDSRAANKFVDIASELFKQRVS